MDSGRLHIKSPPAQKFRSDPMNTHPFALRAIDHVVLRVVDLDNMASFYRDVLGCTDERAQPAIGPYQLRAGGSLMDPVPIHVKPGPWAGRAPGRRGPTARQFPT